MATVVVPLFVGFVLFLWIIQDEICHFGSTDLLKQAFFVSSVKWKVWK